MKLVVQSERFFYRIHALFDKCTKTHFFLLQLEKGIKMLEEFKEETKTKKLSEKIDDLLTRFEIMRSENEKLRQEIVTLKAQSESKNIQISKLEEDLMSKDIEFDDIFSKIEEVLRR